MPETWLDVAIERFGEPAFACPEPLIRLGMNRRCWAWFVDGHNYNLALDVTGGRVHLLVRGPHRAADLHTDGVDPADVDIRAACAFAWPGYREVAGDA